MNDLDRLRSAALDLSELGDYRMSFSSNSAYLEYRADATTHFKSKRADGMVETTGMLTRLISDSEYSKRRYNRILVTNTEHNLKMNKNQES